MFARRKNELLERALGQNKKSSRQKKKKENEVKAVFN